MTTVWEFNAHILAARDQVDEHAQVGQDDHEDRPERLAPAGEVVAAEDVAEDRDDATRREAQMRSYVQDVVGSSNSTAGEIERLAQLQKLGAISDEEFRQAKAKLPA